MHVNDFISDFGVKVRFNEPELAKIDNMTFFVPPDVGAFISRLQKKPVYAGALLATQKGSQFIPGRYLLEHLSLNGAKSVTADKNGAWLWICGKDLWGKSIIRSSDGIEVNDLVLIKSEHDEVLGYGKIVRDLEAKNKMVVQRLFDLGDYLRREKGVFKKRRA